MLFLQNGETALHIAARSGQHCMIIALMEDGAQPSAFSNVSTNTTKSRMLY